MNVHFRSATIHSGCSPAARCSGVNFHFYHYPIAPLYLALMWQGRCFRCIRIAVHKTGILLRRTLHAPHFAMSVPRHSATIRAYDCQPPHFPPSEARSSRHPIPPADLAYLRQCSDYTSCSLYSSYFVFNYSAKFSHITIAIPTQRIGNNILRLRYCNANRTKYLLST